MGMLKIYGIAKSRAWRTLWCAEELGIPYELVETDFRTGAKTPEFLAINPNGRVPVIQDGAVTMHESLAINLYLAQKYGASPSGLWPSSEAGRAHALQWTLWVVNEIDTDLGRIKSGRMRTQDDLPGALAAEQRLQRPFAVIEAHLQGRDWLVEDRFTVADLNVNCIMTTIATTDVDISSYKNIGAWLARCEVRPKRPPR